MKMIPAKQSIPVKLRVLCGAFLLLVLPGPFLNCFAVQGADSLLDKRVSYPTLEKDIQALTDRGYVAEADKAFLSMIIVDLVQKSIEPDTLTYGQLLDSLSLIRRNMMAAIAKENHFGTDSVFIRNPDGVKVFLGLGKMSFEELVAREAQNLPEHYSGHPGYDILMSEGGKASEALCDIMNHSDISWIIGNVMLVEKDRQELDRLRVGDLLEIAKRISASEAFLPFMKDY